MEITVYDSANRSNENFKFRYIYDLPRHVHSPLDWKLIFDLSLNDLYAKKAHHNHFLTIFKYLICKVHLCCRKVDVSESNCYIHVVYNESLKRF